MPRTARFDPDGAWHHVMNRGVDRLTIFRDDRDRRTFLRLVEAAAGETEVRVAAYCLVGNHFHLVLHCPAGGLSAFMWRLSSEYARIHNRRHGRDGALFRGRFLSKQVGDIRYLRALIRYVHRNALDLGIEPSAWPWSSCQPYLGLRIPPRWLAASETLELIGGRDQHRSDLSATQPADTQLANGSDPHEFSDVWRQQEAQAQVREITRALEDSQWLDAGQRRDALRLLIFDVVGMRASDAYLALGVRSPKVARTQLIRARKRVGHDPRMAEAVDRISGSLGLRATPAA